MKVVSFTTELHFRFIDTSSSLQDVNMGIYNTKQEYGTVPWYDKLRSMHPYDRWFTGSSLMSWMILYHRLSMQCSICTRDTSSINRYIKHAPLRTGMIWWPRIEGPQTSSSNNVARQPTLSHSIESILQGCGLLTTVVDFEDYFSRLLCAVAVAVGIGVGSPLTVTATVTPRQCGPMNQ